MTMIINRTLVTVAVLLATLVSLATPVLVQATTQTSGARSERVVSGHKAPRSYWMVHQHGKLVVHPKLLAKHLSNLKFGRKHWPNLRRLWSNESGWNPLARNRSTGACGIPQANPCSKIPKPGSIKSQIIWGLNYIKARYGNPTAALFFWNSRRPYGWY